MYCLNAFSLLTLPADLSMSYRWYSRLVSCLASLKYLENLGSSFRSFLVLEKNSSTLANSVLFSNCSPNAVLDNA